jgi:uncharacterized protein with HEPN domain
VTDERVQRRLEDLARIGAEAAYLVGKGRTAYLADTMEGAMLRNAGEWILMKAAIVAEKLPDDYKDRHPGVDWAGINRMHNLEAHADDKVNDDLLWQALTARIPALLTELGL